MAYRVVECNTQNHTEDDIMETQHVTMRLDTKLVTAIEKRARKEERTRSNMIAVLLNKALGRKK